MFARKTEPEGLKRDGSAGAASQATPVPKAADKQSPSIIGEDLVLTGSVVSAGEVQILGQIEGDVRCISAIVGDTAAITGEIQADDVVVRGRVAGVIRGQRVTLQIGAHVEADVFHESLAIEQGVFFEGKSRRLDTTSADDEGDNGLAGNQKPRPAPVTDPVGRSRHGRQPNRPGISGHSE